MDRWQTTEGRSKATGGLTSILLPTTTPFTETEDLDLDALSGNIRKWRRAGISGFVLLGSTGERVHLEESEYLRTLETARAEIPSDGAFIAGVGQHSTRGTIAEIKKAVQCGADSVLVLTPHYYRSAITQNALVNHYTAVADASPVPVLLYSMPALTGIKIEPETIARLSEHQNIIGVKDSSNDVAGFAQTVKLCPPEFAVLTGNGTVLLDALHAGATGAFLAVGCVVPEICLEIFNAFHRDDQQRASSLQTKLTPLATAVTTKYGIGGLKAALDLAGYHGGSVRAPLRPPDESARAEIAELLTGLQN
ncbi:MAG TPA: dihydrodipicolinate synthase family protein [Pyrinomonadaceae bacterium]|nr:dihydrodipicolinate synthase family protein [Pyrinomonadaceae bacterium]